MFNTLCLAVLLIAILGIGGELTTSVLIITVLILRRRRLQTMKLDYRDLAIGAFILCYGISAGLSLTWIVSSYSAVNVLECVLLFYALRTLEIEQIYDLTLAVVGVISVLSLIGFAQHLDRAPNYMWSDLSLYRHQVTGLTGIPTDEYPMGFFVAAPFICVIIAFVRKNALKTSLLVLFLASAVIVTTFTRAVYLSFGVGVVATVICLSFVSRRLLQRTLIVITLFAGSLSLLAIPSLRQSAWGTAKIVDNISQQRSNQGRWAIYKTELASLSHSSLFGSGPGTYGQITRAQSPQALNSYIQAIRELGISTAFLAVMVLCTEWTYAFRRRKDWPSLLIGSIPIAPILVFNLFWSSILIERLSLVAIILVLLLWRTLQYPNPHVEVEV